MKIPFVKTFLKLVGSRRYGVAVEVPSRCAKAYKWLTGPMSLREAHCERLFLEDLCLFGRIRGGWSRWEDRVSLVKHTLTLATEEQIEESKQCLFQMGVHAGQYRVRPLASGFILCFSTANALPDATQAQIYDETQPDASAFNQTIIRDHDGRVVQEGDFLRVAKGFGGGDRVRRVEKISDGVAYIRYREAQPYCFPMGDAWCYVVCAEQDLTLGMRRSWQEPEPELPPKPVMHYGHWLYFNDSAVSDEALGYLIEEVDECAMTYDARKTGYDWSIAFCTEKRLTEAQKAQIMEKTLPDDAVWNKRLKEGDRLPTDPFITRGEGTNG